MRVAVVQMTSTDDVGANLAAAEKWVAQAAEQGAELIALPENFAYLRREGTGVPSAQSLEGEIVCALRAWAGRHRIWLVGGTFHEAIPGETRVHNTSVAISPRGEIVAVYRKIHLFDVDLSAHGGQVYRESERVAPGSEVASFETPAGVVGLSICYDVRFPELYRSLALRDARFLCVPAAFARETGRDHWEVLLRARAIEKPVLRARARAVRRTPGRSAQLRPFDGRGSVGHRDRSRARSPWSALRGVPPRRPGSRPRVPPGAAPPASVTSSPLAQAATLPRRCGIRRTGRRGSGVAAMAGEGNGSARRS